MTVWNDQQEGLEKASDINESCVKFQLLLRYVFENSNFWSSVAASDPKKRVMWRTRLGIDCSTYTAILL